LETGSLLQTEAHAAKEQGCAAISSLALTTVTPKAWLSTKLLTRVILHCPKHHGGVTIASNQLRARFS